MSEYTEKKTGFLLCKHPFDENPDCETDTAMAKRVSIVGSGNWACAIAKIVGNNCKRLPQFHDEVRMWVFEEEVGGKKLTEIINTQVVHVSCFVLMCFAFAPLHRNEARRNTLQVSMECEILLFHSLEKEHCLLPTHDPTHFCT
jgi:hypothetical protein